MGKAYVTKQKTTKKLEITKQIETNVEIRMKEIKKSDQTEV